MHRGRETGFTFSVFSRSPLLQTATPVGRVRRSFRLTVVRCWTPAGVLSAMLPVTVFKGIHMMEHTAASSAALADELRNVVRQAEELLRAVGEDSGEVMSTLRSRVHDAVDTAKSRLSDLEEQAGETTRRAASAAEDFIRENPWTTVGVAVGVGLLLGALLSRAGGSK